MTVTSIGLGLFGTEHAERTVQLAELAERRGYDNLWLGDSQNIWREAYTLAGAIAARTERLVIGTGVTNPVTRHLSVLASTWATLHELSAGRVALGIGTGDSSLRTMGLEPVRLAALEETVGDLRTLFGGGDVVEPSSGAKFRLSWADNPRVPLYVAASAPRILELAGRIADGVIMLVGTEPAFVNAALERVAKGAAASGRTLDDLHLVLWTPTSIGDDVKSARDVVRAHVARVLIRPLPAELDAETMDRIEKIRASYDYYKHMDTEADHGSEVDDRIVDLFALAGTADECRQRLTALVDLPIDQIAIIPYVVPGRDRTSVINTFAELASDVIAG
ncbi:MAG TPA: LLM class flavin-dependent oxidoreductase [Ilumatobacter sp.]|nr:LLM class flavin-dependent oxidoreductase [Ilumatobacter sp.]